MEPKCSCAFDRSVNCAAFQVPAGAFVALVAPLVSELGSQPIERDAWDFGDDVAKDLYGNK